jgi:hypothetical protein
MSQHKGALDLIERFGEAFIDYDFGDKLRPPVLFGRRLRDAVSYIPDRPEIHFWEFFIHSDTCNLIAYLSGEFEKNKQGDIPPACIESNV